jgi:ribosome-associated protein
MNRAHSQADPTPADEPLVEGPSKTRRKKDMHALQDLGEQLVALSAERLAKVPLPESLADAVREAQRMTKHEARRRQMQYIGKVMRGVDPAPIQAALEALSGTSRDEVARQHRIERLRLELLEDEGVLHRIASTWPGADLQHLRVLRRNALKEREQARPPRSFRELFKALRELEVGPGEPDDLQDFESV